MGDRIARHSSLSITAGVPPHRNGGLGLAVIRCNGNDEKAVIPTRASFSLFNTDHVDCPAERGTISKGICTVLKPIQTVIPRKNTLRSCIFSQASTALRFISLKSDAPLKWNPDSLFKRK